MKLNINDNESKKHFSLTYSMKDKFQLVLILLFTYGWFPMVTTLIYSTNPSNQGPLELALIFWGIFLLAVIGIYFYNNKLVLDFDKNTNVLHYKKWRKSADIKVSPGDSIVMRRRYRVWFLFKTPLGPNLPFKDPNYGLNVGNIALDLAGQEFNANGFFPNYGNWKEVTDDIEVIERYRKYGNFRTSTTIMNVKVQDSNWYNIPQVTKQRIRLSWDIYYVNQNQQPTYLYSTSYDRPLVMHRLAEQLTETLNINLIDDTGEKPEIREPGKTNEFVGLRLKNDSNFKPSDNIPMDVKVKEEGDKTIVKAVSNPISSGDFFKILLGLFLIAISSFFGYAFYKILLLNGSLGLSEIAFIVLPYTGFFALWFFIGLIFINNSYEKGTLIIGPEKTVLKQRRLFTFRTVGEIPTKEIEDINVFQKWFFTKIEIVSDNKRLEVPGNYDWDPAMLVKDTIDTVYYKIAQ